MRMAVSGLFSALELGVLEAARQGLGQVHGARDLERQARGRAHQLDGEIVGQAREDERHHVVGQRQHLECHFRQDGQRAPASGRPRATS